jgi:galactoside O-acetyltransferase
LINNYSLGCDIMGNSFYNEEELENLGLKSYGHKVLISRKASIYGVENISIGSNVRIDDFCILSGIIAIGDYVHIAAYSALYGGMEGIYLSDFSNISSRVSIYAISDDYSGESMTNPMIPDKYKKIQKGKVFIGKHAIIGSSSVILPGVVISDGSAFGAMSLINKSTDEWSINAGTPSRKIKERKKDLLLLEQQFLNEVKQNVVDEGGCING